jgi:hypothetical protein
VHPSPLRGGYSERASRRRADRAASRALERVETYVHRAPRFDERVRGTRNHAGGSVNSLHATGRSWVHVVDGRRGAPAAGSPDRFPGVASAEDYGSPAGKLRGSAAIEALCRGTTATGRFTEAPSCTWRRTRRRASQPAESRTSDPPLDSDASEQVPAVWIPVRRSRAVTSRKSSTFRLSRPGRQLEASHSDSSEPRGDTRRGTIPRPGAETIRGFDRVHVGYARRERAQPTAPDAGGGSGAAHRKEGYASYRRETRRCSESRCHAAD